MGGNWSDCEKPAGYLHAIEYKYLFARYNNHSHLTRKE